MTHTRGFLMRILYIVLYFYLISLTVFANASEYVLYMGYSYLPIDKELMDSYEIIYQGNIDIKNELNSNFYRNMNLLNISLNEDKFNADKIKSKVRDLYFDSIELGLEHQLAPFFETLIENSSNPNIRYAVEIYKDRIDARLGRDEAFEQLKRNVSLKNEGALLAYTESLIDAGLIYESAIEEYKRCLKVSDAYSYYNNPKEELEYFCTLLLMQKKKDKNFDFINSVYKEIERSYGENLSFNQIIKSLCMAAQDKFGDSSSFLSQDYGLHEDIKLINYYRAWFCSLRSDDPEFVVSYLESLKDDLPDNEIRFLSLSTRLCRDLKILGGRELVIKNICNYLIVNLFEGNIDRFPINEIPGVAHVYDLFASSMMQLGEYDEAIKWNQYILDNFYPDSLASMNAAVNYANLVKNDRSNKESILNLLHDVLDKTDNLTIQRTALSLIKEIDGGES